MTGHNHGITGHGGEADETLTGRLKFAIFLTGGIFVAEVIGGWLTNSLALMSDAAHVFMDVFALGLSLFAIRIAHLPPTEKRTFGLHRAEVFVAFVNSLLLVIVTIFIFYKAATRLMDPQPVESTGMLVVAAIGLVVNLVVAARLHSFAEKDLNIKSAFLHVAGDAAASVGVIIGAVVIHFTGWVLIDPIVSLLIGLVIIFGAWRILRDSSHILLEGVPKDVDLNTVLESIRSVEGVTNVHSLHIWSICHNVYALSAHVDIVPAQKWRTGEIFSQINEKLAEPHHIFYTTLQAECTGCDRADVLRRLAHSGRGHQH